MPRPTVLALDLEGTLISNAVSQIPRPGLNDFLERCADAFPRLVMFTAVSEARFRDIAQRLVADGAAPRWFADLEYIRWEGRTKDLRFIPGAAPSMVVLVDDLADYVHAGQEPHWLPVAPFEAPYPESDTALPAAWLALSARLAVDR